MNNTGALKRIDPFAIASFAIPLFVYLLTLAPSVTFFDSGEFITAASSLGSAHSPGYPLFVNYAKPFTFIPFGSIAFRVNIATAISAAAACYGVYLLTSFFLKDEAIAGEGSFARLVKGLVPLSAALTFAFTARLWLQSNHDKPYPLLAFICALVFYLMLLWRESFLAGEERPSYVYLGAFLCGLGTGAHQIVVLMIPVYAWLLVSADRRVIFRVKEILIALSFGLLGFAIQLHLIVRALQKPLLNWGDSKNIEQFLWTMLRKGYPVDKPVRDMDLVWAQMNAFNVPYEFTFVGLAVMIVGLAAFALHKRHLVLSYLVGICSFMLVIVGYFNTPKELIFLTEEFFTPLYLLSAVFVGVGLFAFVKAVSAKAGLFRTGALAVIFTLPVVVCILHYRENDQHENYIAYDYAANTLRSLPQNAVMYTWGDSGAFPLWYLQGVERMREDLLLPHTPHLVFDWYLDSLPDLRNSRLRGIPSDQLGPENALNLSIAEEFPKRPVYIDFSTRYSVGLNEYQLEQHGICYHLVRSNTPLFPPDSELWTRYTLRGISQDSGMFFRDLDTSKAILIYATSRLESGESYLKMRRLPEALQELEQGKMISPEMGPQALQLLNSYGVRP